MSDPNTLGSLVRRRRLESGYSLGQLASKVGKTAAEVRAWERDAEMPEHGIIERLASTLEIDLDDIKKRLDEGKKALDAERKAASEAAAADAVDAEEDAEEDVKPDPDKPVDFPEEDSQEPDESSEANDEVGELPGFAVDDPFTPPPPVDEFRAPQSAEAESAVADADLDLLDAPTEAVPVPVITETAAAARAGRAAAVLEEPPPAPLPVVESAPEEDAGLLRYLEPLRLLFDPHSRYLYWIRAGLTVLVMLIFAVILMQQLGNLLDAVGELLDTIEPTATDPDDLDALGRFRHVV
jgi:transcriptional regulator with XRE-family HTH domain